MLNGPYFGFSIAAGILQTIITKRPRLVVCPAGGFTLAVDPQGNIYPCFMFADNKANSLGNIDTPLDFAEIKEQLREFMRYNIKHERKTCIDCWAINLCSGCLGDIQLSTGRLDAESPVMCNVIRAIAEEIMCFLAEIRDDMEAWKIFVKNYRHYRIGQEDLVRQVI